MKEYRIREDLLAAVVNVLTEVPAKFSFQVLKGIDIMVIKQGGWSPPAVANQEKVKEEKKGKK